jgi:hypothetical protein
MRFLGEAWRVRGELLDRRDESRRGYELIVAAAAAVSAAHPDAARLTAAGALAFADLADLREFAEPAEVRDRRDAAIGALVRVADRAGLSHVERAELLLRLAAVLRSRNGPDDSEHLVARLEQAWDAMREHPGHPLNRRVKVALEATRGKTAGR